MTEEKKLVLDDDSVYWNMWTRQVGLSADELADTDWYKPADDEQIVKKYYIKLNFFNKGDCYLNIYSNSTRRFWEWNNPDHTQTAARQNQFTQAEIDALQKNYRAKGLDLNALKVEVPEDELED